MGITIHYHGKAKSPQAIDDLVEMLSYFAKEKQWEFWTYNEPLRGPFHPCWGHGYGYIPRKESMEKEGIEFFSKMVTADCNGYYHLYETKYEEEVRRSLRKGKYPAFHIDTVHKGICLNLHPQCETLEFGFDMNTLELANYRRSEKSKEIAGFNGFSCKTQFAGFEVHRVVCSLIKVAELYIDFTLIDDESGFYHTNDDEESEKEFERMMTKIEGFGAVLKKIGRERGIDISVGAEIKR